MMRADRYRLETVLGSRELLHELAGRMLQEQIFVYPTETIYGIGGRAGCDAVEKRIADAKKRSRDAQMIVVAGSFRTLKSVNVVFSDTARRLARRFWPGGLTLVLPVSRGNGWLGVRLSAHPFIAALDDLFACPLFSTSANISGKPYDGNPEKIFKIFRNRVDFIVDAGPLPPSQPSTVVRVSGDGTVNILRKGAIEPGSIEKALANA